WAIRPRCAARAISIRASSTAGNKGAWRALRPVRAAPASGSRRCFASCAVAIPAVEAAGAWTSGNLALPACPRLPTASSAAGRSRRAGLPRRGGGTLAPRAAADAFTARLRSRRRPVRTVDQFVDDGFHVADVALQLLQYGLGIAAAIPRTVDRPEHGSQFGSQRIGQRDAVQVLGRVRALEQGLDALALRNVRSEERRVGTG